MRTAAGEPASPVQTTPDRQAVDGTGARLSRDITRVVLLFFPPPLLSLECVSALFLRCLSFFLRVWDWTASVLHANEQNVSGKVVQKQRTHLLSCLFFFFFFFS